MRHLLFLLCAVLFSTVRLFGLSFGTPQQISPLTNNQNPLLVVSSNGNVFAAWVNSISSYNIQVAYLNNVPGGSFKNATVVTNGTPIQIGIDGSGNAFLLYAQQVQNVGQGTTQIFVQRFTPASPVIPVSTTQISTGSVSFNSTPQIAVSQGGAAVVIWQQTPLQNLARSYTPPTTSTPLGIWNPAVTFPFFTLPASLALGSSGNGFAIFASQTAISTTSPVSNTAVQVVSISAP
jgi:hypothetical protein